MSDKSNYVVEGEPTIQTVHNGNRFVEWNIIAENDVDEGVVINLSKKLSVNGITARCSKVMAGQLVCRLDFPCSLLHEVYWDTSMRNILVIEEEIGSLRSIANLPRKHWKLRFAITERVGGFNAEKTALMIAVESQNIERVTEIVSKSSTEEINAKTPFGRTPLHYAIISEDIELVTMILEGGANVNVSGEITPLQEASGRKLEILKMLISKGGEINLVNKYGETTLMTAAASGKKDAVSWLLKTGADKTLTDLFGENALDKAKKNKRYEVEKTLG